MRDAFFVEHVLFLFEVFSIIESGHHCPKVGSMMSRHADITSSDDEYMSSDRLQIKSFSKFLESSIFSG